MNIISTLNIETLRIEHTKTNEVMIKVEIEIRKNEKRNYKYRYD